MFFLFAVVAVVVVVVTVVEFVVVFAVTVVGPSQTGLCCHSQLTISLGRPY